MLKHCEVMFTTDTEYITKQQVTNNQQIEKKKKGKLFNILFTFTCWNPKPIIRADS